MKKIRFFAALCCVAAVFVACEKDKEKAGNFAATGNENGHDYVDLGLSVKWATCNIGATTLEAYGNYYAWGETDTNKTYSWDTYKYGSTLTKYNDSDSIATLEAADDAAVRNWGGKWRMPTDAEWEELMNKCTCTWTTKNGVKGHEVKASNGNAIFLPAAGCYYDDKSIKDGYGTYWSSSLYTNYSKKAWSALFFPGSVNRDGDNRCYGLPIRPVCE